MIRPTGRAVFAFVCGIPLALIVAIYNPEQDPAYRPMLQELLGEIAAQTESFDPDINWYSTYIFITAQNAVTPYHMDREMNFLLQVRGAPHAFRLSGGGAPHRRVGIYLQRARGGHDDYGADAV